MAERAASSVAWSTRWLGAAVEYVMVPVPEELEEEAKLFLMRRNMVALSKARTSLDPETVRRLVPQFNERSRQALMFLVRETLARRTPTIADLAAATGWTGHESAGIVQELSELIWTAFGPLLSVVRDQVAEASVGSVNWSAHRVIVWKDLAGFVAADAAALERG